LDKHATACEFDDVGGDFEVDAHDLSDVGVSDDVNVSGDCVTEGEDDCRRDIAIYAAYVGDGCIQCLPETENGTEGSSCDSP
jgi:hypothetical protein